VNRPQARSGLRTIIGLVAALGLVGALAMPALATHVEPELVGGNENKTCGELGAYGYEFKVNEENPSGEYSDPNSDFVVTITPGEGNTMSFEANLAVEAVFIKGGNQGGNLYKYDPPVMSDSGLQTPGAQGISHVSFCWTDAPGEEPTPTPTPTEEASEAPTEEPTEAPTEEPTEEPTEAPTATVNEGELGGNPTATPAGGSLPDTAVGQFGQVPATVLSLLLLGALAAMVYVRLARQR
jgi:hypothetical protein